MSELPILHITRSELDALVGEWPRGQPASDQVARAEPDDVLPGVLVVSAADHEHRHVEQPLIVAQVREHVTWISPVPLRDQLRRDAGRILCEARRERSFRPIDVHRRPAYH